MSRERHHLWSSRPSMWMIGSSIVDLTIVVVLATVGILMVPLAPAIGGGVAVGAMGLAFVLDTVKVLLFRRLSVV